MESQVEIDKQKSANIVKEHMDVQALVDKLGPFWTLISSEPVIDTPEKTATNKKTVNERELILKGNLNVDLPSTAKIVRIFTSSTFTDTEHERNYLMENTYPRLKQFCQNLGYEFQVVDMRWGVRDEAMDDHMTTELCLKEVDLCNKLSTGPSFVTFLSHKYGYRDFPREIEAGEFELLLGKLKSEESKNLLIKWFIRDDNSIPTTYVLQPISSHLPDFKSSDVDKKNKAIDMWNKQHEQMREALVTSAKQYLDTSAAHKYLRSVTEAEIDRGILDDSQRAFWFDRQIKDIEKQQPSYILSRYKECNGKAEYLVQSRKLLENLRNNKLKRKLPVDHIKEYTIDWTEHGVDPTKEDSHRLYISKLADDFARSVKDGIERAIQEEHSILLNDTICQEVIQHINFCKHKCQSFYGRKHTFKIIDEYLTNNSDKPLVIHGSSGCGKTSIVAMAAKNTFDKKKEKETTIVLRFLGTTPDSSNISALLYSVIGQIKLVYKEEPIKQGLSLYDLTKEFYRSLKRAGKHGPLVVLLDSLDQLDTTGGARQLSWLPDTLPKNVKMIVSTLSDAEYGCFPKLQDMFTTPSCFLPVETLSHHDVDGILHKWLETKQRKLLDSQLKIVLDAFHQCPLPLFLKLSFDEACRWKSFTPPSVSTLQTTVRNVINDLFNRVESLHGKLLVSRALGYLTLSGGGLTETELEDILSCDDDVLNDVYMYWTPPIRRLPPLLLVRIKAELGQYFVDRGADGVRVFYWYHRQFIEAATDRYFSDVNVKEKMCGVIADFFSGIWANGKVKPFKTKNGESSQADRYVTSQPVKLGESYNLRKLNNLPHQRQQANQSDLLKSECLCNFHFILHKIKASGLRTVLDDFSSAKERFVDDEDIKSICDALQLSRRSLQYNSNELPSQLLGRLKPTKSLQPLLDDCKNSPFYYLLPDKTILSQPGGSLSYCLFDDTGDDTSEKDGVNIKGLDITKDGELAVTCKGHTGYILSQPGGSLSYCLFDDTGDDTSEKDGVNIKGLDITKDGELAVTCAEDGIIKTWSMKSGKLVRSFDIRITHQRGIKLCHNDQIIVVFGQYILVGVDFLTGDKLYRKPNSYNRTVCLAGKDEDVMGIFQQNGITLYSAITGEELSHTKYEFIWEDKESYYVVDCVGHGRYMACIFYGDDYALAIFDVIEAKFLHRRVELHKQIIAISPDETNIIICDNYDEAVIYDIQTMNKIRDVHFTRSKGGFGGHHRYTCDGKYLYWACFNEVVAYNLETQETFIAVHHPTSVKRVITLDMKTVVTLGKDKIVRIWDRSKDNDVTNQEAQLNIRLRLDICSPMMFNANPRYIIAVYKQADCTSLLDGVYYLQIYDLAANMVVKNTKFASAINYVLPVDDTRCLLQRYSWVSLFDLQTSSIIRTYQSEGRNQPVINSTKTDFYILSRGGMSIKKYNIETGVCEIIKGCGEELWNYIANKTGTVLAATVHSDERVVFFDLINKHVMYQLTQEMLEGDEETDSICLHEGGLVTDDGRYLIFKYKFVQQVLKDIKWKRTTTQVVVWNIPDKKIHHTLYDDNSASEYQPHVTDFNILNEKTLIIASDDYCIRLYDIERGNLLRRLTTEHVSSFKLVSNKDSPFFLSYAEDLEENSMRLWDKDTFQCIASYCMDTKMKNVEFTSDGYHIIVTYYDNYHVKFDLKGGENISKYQPSKQLEQYKELFKPTDEIVELEIPTDSSSDDSSELNTDEK